MSDKHVLIIDDEPDICELIEITLMRMGFKTSSAYTVAEAYSLLKQKDFDLCLTDMRLPDGNGVELVQHVQTHYPALPIAVITAHGNMESAVKALKAGAFDFVSKPVDIHVLRNLVSSATRSTASEQNTGKTTITGQSNTVKQLLKHIEKLARSQAPVFIHGESGSGKERVAKMIHEQGSRADAPFVPVNCGAIPAELMESEFFGHIKGSFTGANADKQGLFQAADGGTLFLDE
ncbi:MAG: sigma-54-dependent Fis family transcriptional regulator, partial [Gammaproteobacteria bacterium]|nr:sigma-54-dependent Fis family transcriptional regulator [Gammaproteobacteria bacterium]